MLEEDASDEFEGLKPKQVSDLKEKKRRQKHRIKQRRTALILWALENHPRTSASKKLLIPSDWGIYSKDRNSSAAVEKLQRFNQYTRQHWQFSPVTGKLEIGGR